MKRKLHWLSLLVILAFITHVGQAQSIKRQSIGCYGSGSSVNGISINQTAGQPFFTLSYKDGIIGINPGFQQAVSLVAIKRKTKNDNIGSANDLASLNIYPNPATHIINIDFPGEVESAFVKVMDISGKTVLNENITEVGVYQINCREWQEGLYFISVYDPYQQNNYSNKVLISK